MTITSVRPIGAWTRAARLVAPFALVAACAAFSACGPGAQDGVSERTATARDAVFALPVTFSNTTNSLYGAPPGGELQVIPVMWGSSVRSTTMNNITTLISNIMEPEFGLQGLAEYDVASQYSSVVLENNQVSPTRHVITPMSSPCTTSTCPPNITPPALSSSQIENELASQINLFVSSNGAQGLPPSTSNFPVVYVIFLPPNYSVYFSNGPNKNKKNTGCAWHAAWSQTSSSQATNFVYAIIPDGLAINDPNECITNEDLRTSPYEQVMAAVAHETFEAMTDPGQYGGDTPPSQPTPLNFGWRPEIGDPCFSGRVIGDQGVLSPTSRYWSNKYQKCITGQAGQRIAVAPTSPPVLFWSTDDGSVAYSNGLNGGGWAPPQVVGSTTSTGCGGGPCCPFQFLNNSSGHPAQCFSGGDPLSAVAMGTSQSSYKVFAGQDGDVVELNNQTLVKPVANFYTANGITNPLNVGRGYPVTAVSTQLGDNSVWLAWIDNTGNVNAAYLPQNDVIPAGRGLHTVTGANAMPGATVTALVQSPGKLALFWSDAAGGTIWAAYFDCVFQTTCSLATGGWSLALQVNATAGEPAGSTIAAIQPVPGTIHLFFTHANDHSCPPDASCGSIWGQTGTVITNTLGLTYWAPKANVFGGAGALLPGGVNNGVDLTAVTTVPSGGVNLFWSLDVAYGSPTGYGSIQSATCPASCKTLNQFGQAQTVGSPSNSRSYFATPITAIPNLNGMNNGQVTLFWESQDVTGAGTGAGDVMTSSLSGTGGTWSNPEGLFGRTVLVP